MQRPFSEAVAEAAASWFVQLNTESVTPQQIAAWEQWRTESPENERAWQRTQELMCKFSALDKEAGMAVLGRPRSVARRQAIKNLALLLMIGATSAATIRKQPWQAWTADYHTAVGELRQIFLDDGTRLVLDTDTALDVRFDTGQRLLLLHSGAVMIETGHRPVDAQRPFRVTTRHGLATALGTRFTVRADSEQSRVEVFDGAVELRLHNYGSTALRLESGQGAALQNSAMTEAEAVAPGRDGWASGVFQVEAMRLEDFITELSRYRTGRLGCAPAVADLRITGSFPLRDTEAALQAVVASLPVRIKAFTRYWVRLVPA